MKSTFKKLLPFGFCLLWLLLFGVNSSALDATPRTADALDATPRTADALDATPRTADALAVTREGESYLLTVDNTGECLGAYPTLEALLSVASERTPSPTLRFLSVTVEESVELSLDCTLLGEVAFASEVSVAHGAEVILADADIRLASSLCIKDAALRVEGARIACLGASAIAMEHSPLASLTMRAGSILSEGAPAIRITTGSLLLMGGRVSSASGVAVSSTVGLTLTGAAEVVGVGADVYAERPISLSYRGAPFLGELCLCTNAAYEKGEGTPVAWGANGDMVGRITLLDREGTREALTYFEEASFSPEKQFLAVAKPYTVRYFVGNEAWRVEELYRAERLLPPTPPERKGFAFSHFSTEEGGVPVSEAAVLCDLDLFACYKLLAPTFFLASLRFEYDGGTHAWGPSDLSHPLLDEGHLSFSWVREGEVLSSSADTLLVRDVSESGSYTLTVTLTYRGESASATSAPVTLTVEKRRIAPPTITQKPYTGLPQYADPCPSADYCIEENGGGIEAGEYPVILSLTDPENTAWQGSEERSCTLYFRILRAENAWIERPTVSDIFFGQTPRPRAHARFGSTAFFYSDRVDGTYGEGVPSAPGTYYMIAVVEANASYEGVRSEPIAFLVKENRVVSLRVEKAPTRTKYTAFECFDPSGMVVRATYLDGSTAVYPTENIKTKYATDAACFLAKDTYLTLCAEGVETVLSVEVVRAQYDMDGVVFSGKEVVYDGAFHTLSYFGVLPVGLDGIPLRATVLGGGTGVGSYEITLAFSSQSDNYTLPSPMTAHLVVLPLPIEIVWNIPTFVYDGTRKIPTAHYTDVFGTVRELEVDGGAVAAGEGYTATAKLADPNYELRNPSALFSIGKGSYDMSVAVWQGEDFVFDGREKRVSLTGLPSGVEVVAYTDATGVGAGEYLARASLSYDSENYNEPIAPPYAWRIEKASYAMDTFSFLCDDVVYNGEVQYPSLVGTLPVGLDGSRLAFTFDRGVKDVVEGCVLLHAVFFVDSPNYETPDPIPLSLRVLPLGISAIWTELSFVYDGTRHRPEASCASARLTVSGGGVDAGEYVAFCTSLDPNYTVQNDRIGFRIEKASNAWICPLTVSDAYESGRVTPIATAKVGEVVYRYFSDPDGFVEIARPTVHGTYFVRAEVYESKNFLSLSSSLLPFEILEVLPLRLSASLKTSEFFAFDRICAEHLDAVLCYNDGSEKTVDAQVVYSHGDSLRVGDTRVTVVFGDLSVSLAVVVVPARLDLSTLTLAPYTFVFDGTPHTPELVGLPSGVTVARMDGAGAVLAGEHELVVTLDYDAQNYEAVAPLRFSYTIEKRRVALPILPSLRYNGASQSVSVPPSKDYGVCSVQQGRNVGRYAVVLSLRDPDNTVFAEGQGASASVYYEILPLPVTVRMSDLTLYRDGASTEVSYEIVDGALLSGDTLAFTPLLDGSVGAVFDAPNYAVTVIAGELTATDRLSPEGRERLALGIVLLLTLLLLVALAFCYRPLRSRLRYRRVLLQEERSARACPPIVPVETHSAPDENDENVIDTSVAIDEEATPPDPLPQPFDEDETREASAYASVAIDEETTSPELLPQPFDEDETVEGATYASVAIDEGRADRLIRDESAKEMIGKQRETLLTYGRRRSIINVDTLSESFAPGDRIDVNLLKERSLIPYDTGYLKVLARGCIDKPLHVYANDFSLAAVKMLLLSGGSATRVHTASLPKSVRKKK